MRIGLLLGTLAAFGSSVATGETPTSLSNAKAFCKVIDSPCQVSEGKRLIDVAPKIEPAGARRFCYQAAGYMRQAGMTFDRGWVLIVRSEKDGGEPLAFCAL